MNPNWPVKLSQESWKTSHWMLSQWQVDKLDSDLYRKPFGNLSIESKSTKAVWLTRCLHCKLPTNKLKTNCSLTLVIWYFEDPVSCSLLETDNVNDGQSDISDNHWTQESYFWRHEKQCENKSLRTKILMLSKQHPDGVWQTPSEVLENFRILNFRFPHKHRIYIF